MNFGLTPDAIRRLEDVARRLDANTAALEANTAQLAASTILPPKPLPCSGDCKAGDQ